MDTSISLFSGDYSARILTFGAELCSFIHIPSQREYIWQAQPDIWPRHAPVLFPFVGKLKNFEYRYNNNTYTIEQHGFARDLQFKLSNKTDNTVTLELTDSDYTLKRYPFNFICKITYKLFNHYLTMAFEISNNGLNTMPVSFGGHPAFNILAQNDIVFTFENDLNPQSWLLDENFIGKQFKYVTNGDGKIEVNDETFAKDALIFKHLKSRWVKFNSKTNGQGIKVSSTDWPFLGIWSKPKANFVCIEPWQGIADAIDFEGDVTNKEGIVMLEPKETIKKSFEIEII